MEKRVFGLAAAAVMLALGAGPALAEKGGNGNGKGHGAPVHKEQGHGKHGGKQGGASRTVVVTTQDRVWVREYFVAAPVGVQTLPPGIAKKVARGRPLPPGLARQPVPYEVRARLPYCTNGLECIMLGADMLILDAVHGVVRDIVRGVVR